MPRRSTARRLPGTRRPGWPTTTSAASKLLARSPVRKAARRGRGARAGSNSPLSRQSRSAQQPRRRVSADGPARGRARRNIAKRCGCFPAMPSSTTTSASSPNSRAASMRPSATTRPRFGFSRAKATAPRRITTWERAAETRSDRERSRRLSSAADQSSYAEAHDNLGRH